MKNIKYLILIFILISPIILNAQNPGGIYNNPTIQLEEVKGYGSKNNWEQLFFDYTNVAGRNSQVGKMKQMIVAPDGSVFMSDKTTYSISKFDKEGNFQFRFGQKGSKNKDFLYDPNVAGVLDNKYLITSDLQGRIQLFTLNGEFVKLVKLNFIPNQVIPLKNSYIAVLGFVIMSNDRTKYLIIIKNVDSGKEMVIWEKIEDDKRQGVVTYLPDSTQIVIKSSFFSNRYFAPLMGYNKNGNLIVAFCDSGEVMQYSKEGKLIKKFKTDIQPLTITDEDFKVYMKGFDLQLRKMLEKDPLKEEDKEKVIEEFKTKVQKSKDEGRFNKKFPYYSSMIIDNYDNLLLFEFSKESNNQFRVYTFDQGGKSLATSTFLCNDYNLSFMPGKFIFHDGYIYTIAISKNEAEKVPLRIVKFKLKN